MSSLIDPERIPLLWINLDRAIKRRNRMEWALQKGGWNHYRFSAIDAHDNNQRLIAIPHILQCGTALPGLYRSEEAVSKRRTTRPELACLASWKHLLLNAERISSPSGWLLLMEDDLGASLAKPEAWAHSLQELIKFCPRKTLVIQLAPISARVRHQLATEWRRSRGKCLAVKKEKIRSHGNGAVLLHKRALNFLQDPLLNLISRYKQNWHPMLYPWRIRPVADKWIYGALPRESCQVATYPHFCLDAEDSALHLDHVEAFHRPSRQVTLSIWKRDQRKDLIEAQVAWDQI